MVLRLGLGLGLGLRVRVRVGLGLGWNMKHAWLVSRASGQSLDLCPVLPQLKQLGA